MSANQPTSELQHDDVVELTPLLRRIIGARVRDRHVVEDLVQEALARVMAARQRLEPRALAPYAVVTARNLTRSLATSEQRSRRHAHRLIDLREPVSPEEEALRREESRAITTALGKLPQHDQEALVAHEVEGTDTTTLAASRDSTPGAVAAQLSRARARLRVEYLLELEQGGAADRPLPPGAAGPVRRGPTPPAGPGRRWSPARLRLVRQAQRAAARPREDRVGGR